jgi:hypothetical protein
MITIFILAIAYYLVKELEEASWGNEYPAHWSSWWNKKRSWVNKHRWGNALGNKLGFGHSIFTIAFKTFLVFLTDAEHFFAFLMALILAAIVYLCSDINTMLLCLAGYFLGGAIKEAMKLLGINIIK